MRKLLVVLLLAAATAMAVPVGPESHSVAQRAVDLFGVIGNAIDDAVLNDGSLFASRAYQWLDDFGAIALFITGFRMLIGRRDWANGFIAYVWGFVVAKFLLDHYIAPSPLLGGSSVATFFMDQFKGLSNLVDVSRIEQLVQLITNLYTGVEQPSIWNPVKCLAYFEVLAYSTAMQGIIWVVTLAGLIGNGVGATVGRLFIPWYVLPSFRGITLKWINFMLMTNGYRLMGAVYVKIFASVCIWWLSAVIGGNYSLAFLLAVSVPTAVLLLVMIVLTLFVFHWTHDLFSGTIGTAMNSIGAIQGAAFLAVRGR